MLALLLSLMSLSAAEPIAPELEAFLKEVAEKRAGIQTVRAEYREENYLHDEILTTAGKILYIKPGRIIRQTQDPRSTILLDNRVGYLYEPDIKQMQVFHIEEDPQSDVLFMGFDGDMRRLLEAYDLTLIEEGPSRGLRITPKFNPYRDPLFEELRLFLGGEHLLPETIDVLNDDGTRTTYRVSGYVVNGAVDPAESQVILPEGTTVIENSVQTKVGAEGLRLPPPLLPAAPTVSSPEPGNSAESRIQSRELAPPPGTAPSEPAPVEAES